MAEQLTMITARVDDMPLLLAQLARMGVQPLLDEHFPTHGNWVGLSLGWVTVIWLTHILSEANHRLNHVEPWVEQRLHTLRSCTGQPVHPVDLRDDRLAGVLEVLSQDAPWHAFEGAFTQQWLRGYELQPERVRLDSTTASGYWRVTEDGRFQCGHRKDHRPDLPQVQVRRSVLDPLGWPVATDIVPGPRADDPLYLPAVTRVRESIGRWGLLYVGDGHMAALETRASLQAGGDFYGCPLAAIQRPPHVLADDLGPMASGQQPLTRITRLTATGTRQPRADGDERLEPLSAEVAGHLVAWTARRLVVRSRHLARAGATALRARLAKARAAVTALNDRGRGKPRFGDWPRLQAAVEAILTRYRVHGLLVVRDTARVREHLLRRYGSRPATVHVARDHRVTAVVDRQAVVTAIRRLGWRVYATNAPAEQLSLAQAVLAYRSQYLVESDIGRLKGHPLSLTPMSLQRDDQATGLIRRLSVGWRVLTRLEFVVRQRLAAAQTMLAGLYAGNPKRATARPTTERRLKRFEGLTLTSIREGRRRRYHLTPLSRVQRRILALLHFPVDLYTRLYPDAHEPP
jgi:transposase